MIRNPKAALLLALLLVMGWAVGAVGCRFGIPNFEGYQCDQDQDCVALLCENGYCGGPPARPQEPQKTDASAEEPPESPPTERPKASFDP